MEMCGNRSRARRAFGVVAILFVSTAFALGAAATPVSLFGDPVNGWGFNPSDVAAASAIGSLPGQSSFGTSPGTVDITITTPATISGVNVPGGSFANPSTGSSVWSITANDRDYQDLWLVIVGHAVSSDPHGPNGDGFYASANVGLEVDDADPNLRFVSPAGMNLTYLAIFLGDLAQGSTAVLPIEYRVAQALFESAPNDYLFPQYQVAYLEGIPVPEPNMLALGITLGAAGLAVRVRRRRE
jgi:hypothetical protein